MDIQEISPLLTLHSYKLHLLGRNLTQGKESLLGFKARWTYIQILILSCSTCETLKKVICFSKYLILIYKLGLIV